MACWTIDDAIWKERLVPSRGPATSNGMVLDDLEAGMGLAKIPWREFDT